jgi:hypothetical protein
MYNLPAQPTAAPAALPNALPDVLPSQPDAERSRTEEKPPDVDMNPEDYAYDCTELDDL